MGTGGVRRGTRACLLLLPVPKPIVASSVHHQCDGGILRRKERSGRLSCAGGEGSLEGWEE